MRVLLIVWAVLALPTFAVFMACCALSSRISREEEARS
jgi:hypothetical protein